MPNCKIKLSECEIAKLNERLYSSKDILYCADKFICPIVYHSTSSVPLNYLFFLRLLYSSCAMTSMTF